MHSGYNVHLSNENMKCSTGVALQCDVKNSGLTVKKKVMCQKLSKLGVLSHDVLISLRELLGQRR